LSIKIPDWVPKFGGKTWGINIPEIPKLAKGGIVTAPTLAMIGERGPEVVMPLENSGFVDAIASAVGTAVMNAMLFTGTGNVQSGDMVLNIDSKEIARATLDSLNKEAIRLGYKPLLQT